MAEAYTRLMRFQPFRLSIIEYTVSFYSVQMSSGLRPAAIPSAVPGSFHLPLRTRIDPHHRVTIIIRLYETGKHCKAAFPAQRDSEYFLSDWKESIEVIEGSVWATWKKETWTAQFVRRASKIWVWRCRPDPAPEDRSAQQEYEGYGI